MTVFYKENYSDLTVRLSFTEELAILNTDYIQDYSGVDGQILLYRLSDGSNWPLAMTHVPAATPTVDFDVFEGTITLNTIPDGRYELRGRVVDTLGNYTIISAINPALVIGGERIVNVQIVVVPGFPIVYYVDTSGTGRPAQSVNGARDSALISADRDVKKATLE